MKCELCAYTLEACHTAARIGIDRVELCASPAEGGVTPSMATIAQACAIPDMEVSVMIRPRGGDFLYSDEEFVTMLHDIRIAREAGATGVVFGVLTAEGKVDVERTRLLVEAAQGIDTTFHRAIDMTEDYLQAIEDIIATGCTRILTSGGHDKAIDGIDNIAQAVARAAHRIEIMAGSGVTAGNARQLASTGVDALHFSAKKMIPGRMLYRNPRISMGGTSAIDEYALRVVDEKEAQTIVELIKHPQL
ncbi:MAG: copper homeostasis protein CutC [Prevotella sp.]|nr:copper homeostasis protein CutC [Prevotella sp.]